ncbi:MAG: hypothetical protein B7X02_00585 [Rhodospirillales bacterium 12-54-5]|nr:MAG: hypothetical protein B7X02_00585 [Rhodospirillales bacterium 12-54-5]
MNPWIRETQAATAQTSAVDAGLRSYMLRIYNYMTSGILLTGVIAYFAGTSDAFKQMLIQVDGSGAAHLSPIAYVITLAPLAMVFFMMFKLRTMSTSALQTTFWVYAGLMGLSMFSIFWAYTGVSILRVFFITAATFGSLSLYGYTTKRDLTSWGSFLMVGMWAVFLTTIVNMFLHSSGLQLMLSYVGVALALGLTAYDTQKMKDIYYSAGMGGEDALKRASIMGALNLYMDFIYLFMNLLRILGDRR